MAGEQAKPRVRTLIPGDDGAWSGNFSRFATRLDVKDLVVPHRRLSSPGRVPLGVLREFNDSGIEINPTDPLSLSALPTHGVTVLGETGTGKTRRVAAPLLLVHDGSAVVSSVRLDVIDLTYAQRLQMSPEATSIWAPMEGPEFRYPRSRWSPLSYCATWADAQSIAASFVETSTVNKDEVKDKTFWNQRAMNVIGPLLYAARIAGDFSRPIITQEGEKQFAGTMEDVYDWNVERNYGAPIDILIAQREFATGEYETLNVLVKGGKPEDVVRKVSQYRAELAAMQGQVDHNTSYEVSFEEKIELLKHEMTEADKVGTVLTLGQAIELVERQIDKGRSEKTDLLDKVRDLQYRVWGGEYVQALLAERGREVNIQDLHKAAQSKIKGTKYAINHLTNTIVLPDEQQAGVFGVVDAMLGPYQYPQVQDATAANDIDVGGLLDKKGCLYIVSPTDEQDKVQPAVDQFMAVINKIANLRHRSGRTPDLYYVLDEAAHLSIPRLAELKTTARGTGRTVVDMWQFKRQIDDLYGTNQADAIFSGSPAVLILAGTKDADAIKIVQDWIGETFTVETSVSTTQKGETTTTTTYSTRELVTAAFINQLPEGTGLLVYRGKPPILVRLQTTEEMFKT